MRYFAIVLLLFANTAFSQEVDTIRVGHQFHDYDNLSFGKFEYEVYSIREGNKSPSILMSSNVKKEIINGEKYVSITHTWKGADARRTGSFYSLVRPKTFSPVIHIRNSQKGKEAYQFRSTALVALDSAKNNKEAGYELELTEPIFNFEIDLETLSLLPMKENYVAVLRFFHPGSTFGGPDWYSIKVEKSEVITIGDGKKVDAWVLFMDYNGTQPTRFWYTKDQQDFVKMEGNYKGIKIYKTRLF